MVMHPIKPALDGKDLSGFKDPNGKKLFVEMVKVCQAGGEGMVDYYWPKPGKEEPVAKVSYVKLFRPWGWIIGTGIYIDDVNELVTAEESEVRSAVAGQRNTIIAVCLVILGITGGLITWVSKRITGNIRNASEMLKDAAEGEGDLTRRLEVQSKDEIGKVTEISEISNVINDVNEIVSTIATAVEEQSVTTREIAGSVSQASTGVQEVNQNVAQSSTVSSEIAHDIADDIADEISNSSGQAKMNAEQMARLADELKKLVGRFKVWTKRIT